MALLGSRLVTCEERYPDSAGVEGATPSVVVVVVDRDAEAWRPRLAEAFPSGEANSGASAIRLEVIDRATAETIERLEAAGLIQSCVRGTRRLPSMDTRAAVQLTDEEKARAAEWRRQAAKRLKLTQFLLAEEMAGEAADALRESVRLLGCAFAVEEHAAALPQTPAAALAAPLGFRWGKAAALLQPFVSGVESALGPPIDTMTRALESAVPGRAG
ncbi:MAG TPA: hypothetical protein VHE61_18050 [Opitutaceae bacterium]|nr:hypothetical protein [Opitutaceae bacterium]